MSNRVDLATLNKAVAEAKRQVTGAQRLVDRNKSKAAVAASVASALGVAVNQAHKRKIKRQQFIDDGSRIMRGGYHQAFASGAQDAWDDFDYAATEADTYNVDQLDTLQAEQDDHWAIVGDMVDDPSYMDDAGDRIDGKVSRHHGFLDGLFTAVLAFTALDAIDSLGSRIDLYGGSAASEYERGYAGVAKKGNRHPIWHTTSADPCDLCDGRDGEEYTSADDVACWPTDGDFGECCDGGPNCRCYLEWVDGEADDGDEQSGLDNVPDVSLFFEPDLVKTMDGLVFWPEYAKIDLFKGDLPGHAFHGNQWSVGGGNVVEPIRLAHFDGSEASQRSRSVSNAEFQSLAREGKSMLADRASHGGPTIGLDKDWEDTKQRAWDAAQKSWGGATIDSHSGEWVKNGENRFALTVKEPGQQTVSLDEHATYKEFSDAMDRAKDAFPQLRNEGMHLGVFHNDDVGRIDIDPTLVVNTLHEVETIGAYTRAVGGAYNFKDGLGYWPPHVAYDHASKMVKGDVEGHEFHGNRYTGGIGVDDAAIARIKDSLDGFAKAGGMVSIFHANVPSEERMLSAIVDEHEHYGKSIPRDIRSSLKDGMFDPQSAVAVAFDNHGNIVGATGYGVGKDPWATPDRRNAPGEGALQHHIYSTDADQTVRGTGTALVAAIAHEAAGMGSKVDSLWIDTAKGWHEHIGRQVDSAGNSKWSNADVQRIASETKLPATLRIGLQPDIRKGDVAGHAFHGNRWTGGIGGDGKDQVHRVKSIDEAIERLSRGEKVELRQPREIATLVDKLGKIVNDARERGEKPPNINLCNVSVPGTNLFCGENIGYSRVQMPQLTGKPAPGSPADRMSKDSEGVVNLGDLFRQHIENMGFRISNVDEEAQMLRASQNELNGAKVAGIARNYEIIPPARLFVSADNYVVDGHHRWAAAVANSLRDTGSGNVKMQVARVNVSITRLLEIANKFTQDMGIGAEDASQMAKYATA